jgi:hypothetical protein
MEIVDVVDTDLSVERIQSPSIKERACMGLLEEEPMVLFEIDDDRIEKEVLLLVWANKMVTVRKGCKGPDDYEELGVDDFRKEFRV